MTDGVISLDDYTSGNDSSSTDSDTTSGSSDSSSDDLRAACEAIGASYERAKAYVEEHDSKSDLVNFAERLANDDELWEVSEDYRCGNDVHRIVLNFLRSHDKDFTPFTERFYGEPDDPEPGTYNFVQQRSQNMDGNLMFYRVLFPEPVADHWDGNAVLWHEFSEIGFGDDQQDSHIYVTEEWVEEYGDFTIQVDGTAKPVPPAREDLDGSAGGSSGGASDSLVLDPDNYTSSDGQLSDALEEAIADGATESDLRAVLEAEQDGQDRSTAKGAIEAAIEEADADSSSDGSGDLPMDKVRELTEMGWEKDEIIELFG